MEVPDELHALLSGGAGPPQFFCAGPLPSKAATALRLEVTGVGPVRLPLDAAGAAALSPSAGGPAALAPFGRGEETVTDESVRRTWQLEPSQLTLGGEGWDATVQEAVEMAKEGLGIAEDAEVEAQLYKLLIYEPGSLFKPHRDSEKVDGMFATLSILLPSVYEGGELRISHNQWQAELDLAKESASGACFTAFYADCEHEVLPLRSGHRVVLTYNLVWAGEGPPPAPSVPEEAVERLIELAAEWEEDEQAPERACFLFQHRYTEASLRQHGIAALKGRDREAAQMLLAACEGGAELDAHLAKVDFMVVEQGEEMFYMPPEEACGGRWTNVRASKFCPLAGPHPAFSSLPLDPLREELLAGEAQLDFASLQADQQKEVFTGNEANERVRWYYRAGLVFWPASKRLATTVRADPARQALRLHGMLPTGAGVPAPLTEQAAAAAAKLKKRFPEGQPEGQAAGQEGGGGAAGGDAAAGQEGGAGSSGGELGYIDSDEEHLYDEDFACPSDLAVRQQRQEDWEARGQWGPEPEATPAELAAELLRYLASPGFPSNLEDNRRITHILLAATCQLGDTSLARSVVDRIQATQGTQLVASAALAWAFFGWPPSWLPHWEAQLKTFKSNGPGLFAACVDAALNHTLADAAVAGKRALTALALVLARVQIGKEGVTYHQMGTLLQAVTRAANWAHTAGSQLALEATAATLVRQVQQRERKEACHFTHLADNCEKIAQGVGMPSLADSPAFLGVVAACLAEAAAALGPPPAEPADWAKPDIKVLCKEEPLCEQCRAIKEFCLDPEARECALTQPADPLSYDPQTHLSKWSRRWMEDITVDHQRPDERPLPPGATETFHLSKKHSSHTKAVKAWEELAAAREKLAGLWAELLLLRLGGQTAASQRGG